MSSQWALSPIFSLYLFLSTSLPPRLSLCLSPCYSFSHFFLPFLSLYFFLSASLPLNLSLSVCLPATLSPTSFTLLYVLLALCFPAAMSLFLFFPPYFSLCTSSPKSLCPPVALSFFLFTLLLLSIPRERNSRMRRIKRRCRHFNFFKYWLFAERSRGGGGGTPSRRHVFLTPS